MTLVLIVYVLAVARITRFINYDALFDSLRNGYVRAFKGHPTALYFITCPWCVGMWVCFATAWIPIWHPENPIARYLGIALAASMLIGVATPLSEDDELDVEPVED